ncbi:hypothetical protein [Haloactinomyces albus]|uniref:Cobalamin biosynthesis Mg chelatase CobN n=1 Tax=Haloactinomyces albus TaxID=1352928 RepID=A0AAE3ZJQ3_9ACTN|nr:hypothetical protein [Haloactinomyces albus]MDR7304417.1 cobalamin biosynthesis Mg chelatase CobN [Haloactinomyces albus]
MTTAAGSSRTKQQQSRRTSRSTKQPEQQSQQSSTQRSSGTQQSSTQRSGGTRQRNGHGHSTTVELPFVTARFHVPDIQFPTSSQDFTSAAESVRAQLPSREHSMFYGGLALGTAFAFIEWPVALAIGVGHALLNRHQHPESPR